MFSRLKGLELTGTQGDFSAVNQVKRLNAGIKASNASGIQGELGENIVDTVGYDNRIVKTRYRQVRHLSHREAKAIGIGWLENLNAGIKQNTRGNINQPGNVSSRIAQNHLGRTSIGLDQLHWTKILELFSRKHQAIGRRLQAVNTVLGSAQQLIDSRRALYNGDGTVQSCRNIGQLVCRKGDGHQGVGAGLNRSQCLHPGVEGISQGRFDRGQRVFKNDFATKAATQE